MNKKTYITPRQRVAELETETLVAQSELRSMSVFNGEGDQSVSNAEDVWAKENKGSLWDNEW